MNNIHQLDLSAIDMTNGLFVVSGPLPVVEPRECPDYFVESIEAHKHYLGHRSSAASDNTMTFHASNQSGEVVGYISFRVAREDDAGSTRIFVSVEYIYVMQKFRMRSVSKLLMEPLIQEVQTVLHRATRVDRRPKVQLHSASHPQSAGGDRVIRALEQQLLVLSKCYVGVDLIGRHQEQLLGPARAC